MNKYLLRHLPIASELERLASRHADVLQLDEVRQGVYQVLAQRHGPESVMNAVGRFLMLASALERGSKVDPSTGGVKRKIAMAVDTGSSEIPPAMRDLFHAFLAPQEMRGACLDHWTFHVAEARGHTISSETREHLVAAGEMFMEVPTWLEYPETAVLTWPTELTTADQGGVQ